MMNISKVGSRGVLFSFDDLGGVTNVYVIEGSRHIFIIDTYIGPEPMEQVNSYINSNMGKKPLIVVNTHYHWDHVWGNCIYKSYPIIAHEKCFELLVANGESDLQKREEYAKGKVEITLPNLTFTDTLVFKEDGVKLFYSPGHTEDSISIYDEKDKVLIVGDNLERPIPYLMSKNLDTYMEILEDYLRMDFTVLTGGHIGLEGKELVSGNAEYIRKFAEGTAPESDDEEYKYIHESNKKLLAAD